LQLNGKPSKKVRGISLLLAVLFFSLMAACTVAHPPDRPTAQKMPSLVDRPRLPAKQPTPASLPPLGKVKPLLATEEKMPFEGKIFSLSARSAPLQDVIMGIAKEAGLNLVIEKGVDPLEPVSIEVNNLSLRNTLDILFSAYDYFYAIEGNTLRIKAAETRFFKFEHPLFANNASSSVGGDVLGGGGGGGITGTFSVDTQMADEFLDVWAKLKEALKPGGGSEGGLLSENGNAQIDPGTGTIVVTDARKNLDLVEEYLNRIQASVKRQVIIEAKIMEVTLDDRHQFGIDWSYMSGDTLVNQTLKLGGAVPFSININDAQGGSWFMDALETQGDVNVLSSPRIHVCNNQSAVLSVGQTIPYIEWNVEPATTTTPSRAVPQISRAQAGVSLGVTPMIGEDGVVTLHVVPVITDQNGNMTFTFEGNTFDVPILMVRGTDSIVRAPDGTTVVMAGLIQEKHEDNVSGIPLLKDIPLIGALFTQHKRSSRKVELVITLTPTIVEN